MKSKVIALTVFFVSVAAYSQQPVKINLLTYFNKITPPPASAQEAYKKCLIRIPGENDQVIADSVFQPLVDELEQIQKNISMPPKSPQADFAEKMKDPEFQKKMEAMSEEERIKMMMEMNQAMGATPGPMKPEPLSVRKCMEEVGKLNEMTAGQYQNLNIDIQKSAKHELELEAKHAAIDTWEQAEIKKLPEQQVVGEGDSGPDPKAVYSVKMNAMKKHLALVNDELKTTGKSWTEQRDNDRKRFAPYEASLEKIHFGDDAKNQMSKTNLSMGQTLMVGSISNLVSVSKKAYQDAANWYSRLVALQKSNQQ